MINLCQRFILQSVNTSIQLLKNSSMYIVQSAIVAATAYSPVDQYVTTIKVALLADKHLSWAFLGYLELTISKMAEFTHACTIFVNQRCMYDVYLGAMTGGTYPRRCDTSL
ncbi:hypothetical protein BMS3Bbin15_00529 [archaeon BMS3Bbin15]|nr:hypothetical protein BMS3Bbin15_00529 [archaeon BMS3Bbin15]